MQFSHCYLYFYLSGTKRVIYIAGLGSSQRPAFHLVLVDYFAITGFADTVSTASCSMA